MALLKMSSKKWLSSGYPSLLPDDRPITAISVVEDIDKCPPNFTVISKTYDQDIDADLWRESGLFIKKKGRYICHSKTEGVPNYVVQEITVINERESPPDGYSMIPQTIDTDQKAWRKKQVCYKLRNRDACMVAVTDIIVCSRIKKAPTGFTYAGEVNGVIICYKLSAITNREPGSQSQSYENINVLQTPSPNPSNGISNSHRAPPERPPKPKFSPKPQNGIYPQVSGGGLLTKKEVDESLDRDYEVLSPSARIKPTRPAPEPPITSSFSNSMPLYGTLPGSSDLDGVPFVLNPLLSLHSDPDFKFPVIKARTRREIDKEYYYDFRAEKET
ncbi:multivesicular body subunit 12B [Chelonus insularis]|uniref:multivesicular body subunit 12B n=1 Tax=Chelonus insularis TaxID=460826 RepID=UPI00158BBDD4|nr:multivesicular body subunit 12B [Chelonus insularis]XP_034934546.1 multivesicular body subunit 12B [Chelonus insularis]XP_034934547.1 multivesicular body subunit 12B [Chelonus insularis]